MSAGEPASQVALICGGGQFPLVAARAAQARGQEVFLLALKGIASEGVAAFPHVWLGVGQLGAALREIETRGIKDICFIGGLGRPEFADLRPDWGAIKRLPDIFRLLKGGDDHALKGVIRLFEHEGLRVIGVETLAPELLAAKGAMNARAFPKDLEEDLVFGHDCLAALSAFDCGQALVLSHRRIVALEAAEGTDAMLLRVAELREKGRWRAKGPAGMLIKAPKKGQDLRVDLPAMGPETVASAAKAGLLGIAVEAGKVLILDRDAVAAQAEKAGLFLYGFSREAGA
ncbi:MAG TPA: UDP-2,3-diacylglucosamine diphosphatase LpxI [Rhodoblastus sp.]|nr:UDP-2,3-diacylglucosamine diphosphatase LpxI [Rhodoblastus sp.]